MSVPTTYTAETLKAAMLSWIPSEIQALLTITVDTFDEPVVDALIALGESDIGDVEDIPGLRAVARWKAWERVADEAATLNDFSTPEGSESASQIAERITKSLERAAEGASEYVNVGEVTFLKVDYIHDPYTIVSDSRRTQW